jgi:polyferredoxin
VDVRNSGFPWHSNLPLAILMVFAFAAALLKGNLYCSYVCPFGALQEGAARISPKKIVPDARLYRGLRWLRWIVTILAVYAIAALGGQAMRTVEPFSMLFMRYPGTVALVQAGVILLTALFVRRVWCRFLCPTGLVLDVFAQLGCKVRHLIRRRVGKRHACDETS